MAKNDVIQPILEKVQQLEPNDPVRRGLLERLADWLLSPKTSQRARHWERVEKESKFLKY